MTPRRTVLKPLRARKRASSRPNPSAEGRYGGSLDTMFRPCRISTRPSGSVIQRPACPGAGAAPAGQAPRSAAATASSTARRARIFAVTPMSGPRLRHTRRRDRHSRTHRHRQDDRRARAAANHTGRRRHRPALLLPRQRRPGGVGGDRSPHPHAGRHVLPRGPDPQAPGVGAVRHARRCATPDPQGGARAPLGRSPARAGVRLRRARRHWARVLGGLHRVRPAGAGGHPGLGAGESRESWPSGPATSRSGCWAAGLASRTSTPRPTAASRPTPSTPTTP